MDTRATAYPSARAIAPRLATYFADHIRNAPRDGGHAAALADEASIETIVDAAFWASLRREEGYAPRISLAYVAPSTPATALLFERPLPLTPDVLTRVAPAVERPGIHLGVWRHGDGLAVWGATRALPPYCLALEVVAPGVLVVKHPRGDDSGKFVNVAVLEGDQVKVIDENGSSIPDCPELVASLLGFDSPASWKGETNVLVELALSMRAHGRGGAMLVLREPGEAWLESMVQPIAYAVTPPFDALKELMQREDAPDGAHQWGVEFRRVIDSIAGLTAVDGATIITADYQVLAFGAKIVRRRGSPQVDKVVATEPIEGTRPIVMSPSELGGTRHLSAAQFVYDQRSAVALVASQDGRFTVFAWSPCEDMVHAHRVEALLL